MRHIPELVFVLHRDAAVEADLQQDREERQPVHNPLSGNAITPPSLPCNAHLLQHWLNHFRLFGMHRQDSVFQLPCRTDRVNVLPHEMRGIEFQPQPLAWNAIKNGLHRSGVVAKLMPVG